MVEYDLDQSCVKEIVIDRAHFHCTVDSLDNPSGVLDCDPKSYTFVMKEGSTTKNCISIHIVKK